MAPPVFKTELRGVTLRGWFDSIPSPPIRLLSVLPPHPSLSRQGRGNLIPYALRISRVLKVRDQLFSGENPA